MADFIVLTKSEAEAVRGPTTPGYALNPIELKDGTFILPVEVLSDPAHSMRKGSLEVEQTRKVPIDEMKWKVEDARDEAREADAIEARI